MCSMFRIFWCGVTVKFSLWEFLFWAFLWGVVWVGMFLDGELAVCAFVVCLWFGRFACELW